MPGGLSAAVTARSPLARAAAVPRRRLLGLLALFVLLAAACDSGSESAGPTTAPSTVPPPTEPVTTAPEVTTTTTTVPGPPRSTTTLSTEISPGSARISGTVLGPQGPVAGALVRVERLVGDQVAAVEVNAANGSFTLPSVRGGRYLVRAWKQPDLYQPSAEGFFLAADEEKSVELRMTKVSDVNVQTTVEPNPPPRDEPFSITIFLYAGSVNGEGVLQANPRAGQDVEVVLGPGLGLNSTNRARTDGGGKATFSARCRTPGPQTGELRISAEIRLPLALPECR